MPDSVASVDDGSFASCQSLLEISLTGTPINHKVIDGVLFSISGDRLIGFPAGKSGAYTVPSGVTEIAARAFQSAQLITAISLPSSLTTIGDNVFRSCNGLSNFTMPNSVTSLGNSAFYECLDLTNITLSSGLTAIDDFTFYGCSSLASVAIPDGMITIGTEAFYECSSLESISIPDSVTSIGEWAFYYCESMTSGSIGDGIVIISPYTFADCESLVSLSLGQNVEIIDDEAFYGCFSLKALQLPDSCVSIGAWAFAFCSSLNSLSINNGLATIEEYAFTYCRSLLNVSLAESVTTVGDYSFSSCSSLRSLSIGSDVSSIGSRVVSSSANFTDFIISADNSTYQDIDGVLYSKDGTELIAFTPARRGHYSVESTTQLIHKSAFLNCELITSVTIPSGILEINDIAFYSCRLLKSVLFEGDAPSTLGNSVFNYANADFAVYHYAGTSGFDHINFSTYSVIEIDGAMYPHAEWLLSQSFSYDTSLSADPDDDGIELLLAYALNTSQDLVREQLPSGVVAADSFTMSFFGGQTDVTYEVEVSSDLATWSTDGVTLSAPDTDSMRVASVPMAGNDTRFLRLNVFLN